MGRLEEFKERINKNSKLNISVDEANKFIVEFLTNDYLPYAYTNLGLKLRLLNCLKVSLCEVLQLKEGQIKYLITNIGSEKNLAGVRRVRCDGNYVIVVNEEHVQWMDYNDFLYAILHEYGHIYLVEAEIRGENMPKSIFTDHLSLENESAWQKRGAKLKYKVNQNEFLATKFARRMVDYYLSLSEIKGNKVGTTKRMIHNKLLGLNDVNQKNVAKINLAIWKKISQLRGIPESTSVSLERPSMGIPSVVQELDRTLDKIVTVKSFMDADMYLLVLQKHMEAGDYKLETDFMFKIELLNSYCYKLANQLGCGRSEVGFMFYPEQEEFMEIVTPYKYDKNCPLKSYILVNLDAFESMETIQFYNKVTKYMTEHLEIEQSK